MQLKATLLPKWQDQSPASSAKGDQEERRDGYAGWQSSQLPFSRLSAQPRTGHYHIDHCQQSSEPWAPALLWGMALCEGCPAVLCCIQATLGVKNPTVSQAFIAKSAFRAGVNGSIKLCLLPQQQVVYRPSPIYAKKHRPSHVST